MDNPTDSMQRLPKIARSIKLCVCVSGGGTTLTNLVRSIQSGELDAEVTQVVASSSTCGGIGRAQSAGLPLAVVDRKTFDSDREFSDEVFAAACDADFVVLAGFLKLLVVPTDWAFRVINIHPSLIPSFCGKGYFGRRVHQAAIERGVKVSGCTVHFVDNEYDHGPIIAQRCVPVLGDDTPETLAARVFEQECQVYPEALRLIASGRLYVDKDRTIEVMK